MVIIFRSAIIGVGAQLGLTLRGRHFCPKMYVHENVVRIFFGGGYKSLYTPVSTPLLISTIDLLTLKASMYFVVVEMQTAGLPSDKQAHFVFRNRF